MLGIQEWPRQGLGCMRMRTHAAGDPDHDPTRVVHAAVDAGVTLIDTADLYRNEELVGRAVRARRDELLLCSKFGVVRGEGDDWSVRADAAYVRQACDASLARLGVDTIDLYYLHNRSDETPIEETVSAMAGLVEAGKVRAIGLSNVTEDDLRRAHDVHPVAALQVMWSLTNRGAEPFLPTLAELGITLVAHSPTGHGSLRDIAPGTPRHDALAEVARAHGASIGQVALAWVHRQAGRRGHPVVPLPGTTRVSHLRENVAASTLPLTDAELALLDTVRDSIGHPDHP